MSPAQIATALLPALEASGFVGTWETDLTTGTVSASERFAELLGLVPPRAADGVPLSALLACVHAADRERVGALVHEAHRTAGRFEAEFRTAGSGSSVRWVAARGQVETDGHGRPVRCRGIAIDVTDTRQTRDHEAMGASRALTRVAEHALAAHRAADTLGIAHLRTLLDLLLFEVGRELAKASGIEHGSLH